MSVIGTFAADEIVKSATTLAQDQTPTAALRSNTPGAYNAKRVAARIAQRLRDAGFVCEVFEPPPR